MTTIPRGPEAGAALGPYVRAIRSRALIFALVTLAALGVAALVLTQRTPTYSSTARLLITPLPQDNQTYLGIPLLRDSGDPTRTAQTAAALIDSPAAAAATATRLGRGATLDGVENAVKVEPVGESNIVAITASDAKAPDAAALANTYASSVLATRRAALLSLAAKSIKDLKASAGSRGESTLPAADQARLSDLRSVLRAGDPTVSLAQAATVPTSTSNSSALLVLVLALVAGLTLGAVVAVLIERLDHRVRDVDELSALAPLPILARVPRAPRLWRVGASVNATPAVHEAFRTLQIRMDQRRADSGKASNTIVVTSASTGDGKTTTAVCLSLALVGAGHQVILIDGDLRRGDIGPRFGLDTSRGLVTLLAATATLSELLQPVEDVKPLRVLTAAGGPGDVAAMQARTRRIAEILAEAGSLADYVVVDTPPLGVVGDALSLTPYADQVLLVGRPQNSDRDGVSTAVDLLEQTHTPPTGWVVIGDEGTKRKGGYY